MKESTQTSKRVNIPSCLYKQLFRDKVQCRLLEKYKKFNLLLKTIQKQKKSPKKIVPLQPLFQEMSKFFADLDL